MKIIPNKLCRIFGEVDVRRQLMAEYGDSNTSLIGENDRGEMVDVSIYKDHIIVKTYQNNKWVHVVFYGSDGNYEGESLTGRWINLPQKED